MKETYRHEFNAYQKVMQKLLGMWRINKESIDFKWGYFAPRFGFELMIHRGGYFDQHYAVSFCPIWGHFHIKLPFKTKIPEGCDMPNYGIQIHDATFWVHLGGPMDEQINQCKSKWVTWDLPFFHYIHDGVKVLTKKGWTDKAKNEYSPPYSDKRIIETHDYTYTLKSGEVQKRIATCFAEKRTWHRKWFPFLKMVRKSICVEFDNEVGEGTGSWKGGVVGTSYDLIEKETIEQCLKRMEKEKKFNR